MAWEKANRGSRIKILKNDEMGQGVIHEGYYGGRKYIQTKSYGEATVHQIIKEDGDAFGVFGTKVLDDQMDNVETGMAIRLTWLGKVTGNIGTQYHDFEVQFDRENTITEDEVKAFLKEAEETEDDGTAEAPANDLDVAKSVFK